jgi:hypothetical protein
MAQTNDPTAPVLRAVETYQSRLFELWKGLFKKIASKFSGAAKFFDNVVAKGHEIASKVGQAVVDGIVAYTERVFGALEAIPALARRAIRLGNRIIALIRRAADPNRILGTLKKLFSRYVKMLKDIFGWLRDFYEALDPLGKALAVVNTFRNVLRLVVKWVGQVSGANSAVRKAKGLVKKVVRAMQREIRDAVRMRREVLRLRPG